MGRCGGAYDPFAAPVPYLRGGARGAADARTPRAGMTLRRDSSSGQENKPFLGVCSGGRRRAGGGRRGELRWGDPPRRGGQGGGDSCLLRRGSGCRLLKQTSPGQPAPLPGQSCRAVGGASRPLAAAADNWLGEAGCARAAAPGRGRAPPRGRRESGAALGGRRGDAGQRGSHLATSASALSPCSSAQALSTAEGAGRYLLPGRHLQLRPTPPGASTGFYSSGAEGSCAPSGTRG